MNQSLPTPGLDGLDLSVEEIEWVATDRFTRGEITKNVTFTYEIQESQVNVITTTAAATGSGDIVLDANLVRRARRP